MSDNNSPDTDLHEKNIPADNSPVDNPTGNESSGIPAKKGKPAVIVTVIIICLCVLLALLIVLSYIQRREDTQDQLADEGLSAGTNAQNPGTGGGNGRNATAVRVTPVRTATIENSVVITGDVLARNQISIFPVMAGKLTEVRLGIGDSVKQGDVVAMVDPSRPGEIYSYSPVISPVSGTVLQAPYSTGDTVSTQTAVYIVGDLSSLRIELRIPERFVSSIRRGLGAQVTLEAIPGEVFYAEVDEVSPVLDPASRTMRILLRFVDRSFSTVSSSGQTIVFSRPGGRVKAGMFATVSLVTQTRENVPVIPRNAVINTYGSWIVFVVDENGIARRREVELGIESEESVEVLSGVGPGDSVISAGQNFLTDGDPVRIVE
ncbi:MAG: efflux RND transporter periplasmic adaptor subunit [Treponema sp.]|nr:efflux RND transporter periplasmic adaptor subunit [Treponema sp.]